MGYRVVSDRGECKEAKKARGTKGKEIIYSRYLRILIIQRVTNYPHL